MISHRCEHVRDHIARRSCTRPTKRLGALINTQQQECGEGNEASYLFVNAEKGRLHIHPSSFKLFTLLCLILSRMAKLLAPYSNAMQLGQGFNSYTQQICINDAVTPWPETKQDTAITTPSATSTPTGTDTQIAVAPQAVIPPAAAHMDTRHATMRNHNVSQIVSYSSRFVDKLSDITGMCATDQPRDRPRS